MGEHGTYKTSLQGINEGFDTDILTHKQLRRLSSCALYFQYESLLAGLFQKCLLGNAVGKGHFTTPNMAFCSHIDLNY